MKGRSANPISIYYNRQLVWIGIGLGVLSWILGAFIHVLASPQDNLVEQLLTPSLHSMCLRLIIAGLVITFSVYTQVTVNKRQRLQEALRESEATLRSILHAAPIGIGVVENRVIKFVNDFMCSMTGYSREELLGQGVRIVYESDEEFHRVGKVNCTQIKEKGTGAIETRFRCKDGRVTDVWLSSCAVDPSDLSRGVAFTALDISHRKLAAQALQKAHEKLERRVEERTAELTGANKRLRLEIEERRHAEEALRQSEEKLAGIIASVTDHMSMIDDQYKIMWTNDLAKSLFGPDLVGKECYSAYRRTDKPCKPCVVKKCFEDEKIHERETEVIAADGNRMVYWLTASVAARDRDGQPKMVMEVSRDITEGKRTEELLRRANEKLLLESKERKRLSKRLIELLEGVRHRISMELHDQVGQTLTTLKMDLESVKKHAKGIDDFLKDQVQAGINKTVQCMRDIKNISSGLRPNTLDALGLVPSIRALFDDIKETNDMEIHFFSKNVPKRLDSEKELALYRIVQEAVTNILTHAQAGKIFVNLVQKGEVLSLTVEDDGIGFEPERIEIPRKTKGGMGLPIMRERSKQLGGEFTIESRIDGGTLLLAEIPI
jgi:PAS domain S-box-containing protein